MDHITVFYDETILFPEKNKHVYKYKSASQGNTFNVINHNVLKRRLKVQQKTK